MSKITPYVIAGVSRTQFSIARHFGVVIYNRKTYTYMPQHDELIRDDVLKWVTKRRKEASKPTEQGGFLLEPKP
jgi:hypothetical protein